MRSHEVRIASMGGFITQIVSQSEQPANCNVVVDPMDLVKFIRYLSYSLIHQTRQIHQPLLMPGLCRRWSPGRVFFPFEGSLFIEHSKYNISFAIFRSMRNKSS